MKVKELLKILEEDGGAFLEPKGVIGNENTPRNQEQ